MPRALREFRGAVARQGAAIQVLPAPIGLAPRPDLPVLLWLPSGEGTHDVAIMLRELLGLAFAPRA
jgi:hypothetical protein